MLCALLFALAPLAIQAQPRIVTWGDDFIRTNAPTGLPDIKAIAAGYQHALALRSNGTVIAWGDNSLGQTNVSANATSIVAIAAGEYHSLAVRSNGTVAAWGLNNNGQTTVPASATSVVAVAAGSFHSVALKSNGTVVAWGNGFQGQTNVPVGLNGVRAISAGDVHTLALKSNGTVVAWGDNASGQINLPANLFLTNLMTLAAGYHHNLGVRSNGTVVAWDTNGVNVYGESTVPGGLSGVQAVAGGYFYSMALKSNGTVLAWGQNFTGQTNVPAGLTNVTAIAAAAGGGDYSLALTPTPVCPPGFPDNFECRSALVGSNISFSVSNIGATAEPGEPSHFDNDGFASLWYTWTAPFSGGAVISSTADLLAPCLAVYTGTNLATLTKIVANNTAFHQSRVVFGAVAGTTYQIAVDATTANGSTNWGNFNVNLVLNSPPANDAFASRTVIATNFFEASGSFIGGTTEASEPAHTNANGSATFQQTLWWSWTAPTNLGVISIPVSLIADAASFPPNIGVYTGTAVGSLTKLTGLTAQTNGMTRVASFVATAGQTYQIALGGKQFDSVSFSPITGVDPSPRFGNFRLRLNIHALALTFTSINLTNNGDDSTGFGATLQATNFGAVTSNPLRVQVTANSGVSVLGADNGYMTNGQILLVQTNLSALNPGQGITRRVVGLIPAPSFNPGAVQTNGVGYGAFGQFQEQVDTNWFTADQSLLAFGVWPDLGGFDGPGGGVIRLDPGLTGAGFNPLAAVGVVGTTSVVEGTSNAYTGKATYANNYQYMFSNTVWTATLFNITTNGLFSSGIVTSNTPVTLSAQFSSGGFLYNAVTNITVLNLPSPTLAQVKLFLKTNITFQIQGVSNRKHVIEFASALTNGAVWAPLSTNTLPGSGLLNFTNAIGTNQQRFFRARESN